MGGIWEYAEGVRDLSPGWSPGCCRTEPWVLIGLGARSERAADACIPTSACSEDLSVLGKMLEACALKQDSPGQPLVRSRANICRSFRAEHILLSRTQGYASLYPGLRASRLWRVPRCQLLKIVNCRALFMLNRYLSPGLFSVRPSDE